MLPSAFLPDSAITSPRFNPRAKRSANARISASSRKTACGGDFIGDRGYRSSERFEANPQLEPHAEDSASPSPRTETAKMTNVSQGFYRMHRRCGAFAAAGCGSSSGGGGGTTPPVRPTASPTPPGQKIQHVIILIQENRTVDALFNGFPGADTVKKGLGQDLNDPSKQITIPLKQMPLEMNLTPENTHQQFLTAFDGGKMDGFNTIEVEHNPGKYVYQYANPADVQPYWNLAKQYVLADHTFSTQGSSSFTGHQDLIAGGTLINATQAIIDNPTNQPWGCDSPKGTLTSLITTSGDYEPGAGPFPCFTYKTLRDLLDAKAVSWKYYAPVIGTNFGDLWSAFDAIRQVRYGSEWQTNVSSTQNVLGDISGGKLASWSRGSAPTSTTPTTRARSRIPDRRGSRR